MNPTPNWRGARNKALSDTWCNVKFSFCFTSKYKAIWKGNLVVNQTSLRAFFHVPLQLLVQMLYHWAMGDLWKQANILHTARIRISLSGICATRICLVDLRISRVYIQLHLKVGPAEAAFSLPPSSFGTASGDLMVTGSGGLLGNSVSLSRFSTACNSRYHSWFNGPIRTDINNYQL